jgi:hypothetical protein
MMRISFGLTACCLFVGCGGVGGASDASSADGGAPDAAVDAAGSDAGAASDRSADERVAADRPSAEAHDRAEIDALRGPVSAPVRCGAQAVCVPPATSAITACRAALELLGAEELAFAYEPSDCLLLHKSAASATRGEIRGAAVLEIVHADMGSPMVVVFAGEHGFDRVVPYLAIGFGVNEDVDHAITGIALEDLVPGGSLEARIESHTSGSDSACTEPLSWDSERDDVSVCGIDTGGNGYCTPRIARAITEIETRYSDWDDERGARRATLRFTQLVSFDRGRLVVRRTSGRVPSPYRRLFTRRQILELPALANDHALL